jgi:hypothetical protein
LNSSVLLFPFPGWDSGVFLYFGNGILKGLIPYRDMIDHKGPLIYYINMLGLWLADGQPVGVWFLQIVFLSLSIIVSFHLIFNYFGLLPAVFGTISWLLIMKHYYDRGNLVQEYAILFQFLGLWLFSKKICTPTNAFLFGLSFAATFLLLPNLIAVFVAIFLYRLYELLIFPDRRRKSVWVAVSLLTFLVVIGMTLLYFYLHDAGRQFVEQIFLYNIGYSKIKDVYGVFDRLGQSIVFALFSRVFSQSFLKAVLIVMACFGFITAFIGILFRTHTESSKLESLLTVSIIGFSLEMLFSGLSGYNRPHYYLVLLPWFCIFIAYAVHLFLIFLCKLCKSKKDPNHSYFSFGLAGVVGLTVIFFGVVQISARVKTLTGPKVTCQVQERIEQMTELEDRVLVLGGMSTTMNFITKRLSPTPLVYQNDVVNTTNNAAIFITTLKKNPPKLIVENRMTNFSIGLAPNKRVEIERFREFYQFADKNYSYLGYFPCDFLGNSSQWDVYRLNDPR